MTSIGTDVSNGINNVRTAFSSWDSCMSKAYCKWPVIAAIVIGSLIALSIVWCFASCLCCGATLCGSCARCLTCFGCCGLCGRGGGGGGRRSRHKDDYTQVPPTPYNGYQPQPSPMSYQPPSNTAQYAQFDAPGKKVHADSLPAMPSWDTARSRRVEDQSEPLTGYTNDVEMGHMHPAQPVSRTRGYDQISHGPVSPITSPVSYGHFQGQAQPYSSDIGAQRLQHQQTVYQDIQPTPMSPAPTYRTAPSIMAAGAADRFTTMSPSPSEYHNQQQQQHYTTTRDHAWTPLPTTQHNDAEYPSYRRSLSPPMDHQAHYSYDQHDQSGARPPSLLQIGRKPVMGSQREV